MTQIIDDSRRSNTTDCVSDDHLNFPVSWTSFRSGDAVVTAGKPFYGKRKIIANAPLSAINFDALITALQEARDAYLNGVL